MAAPPTAPNPIVLQWLPDTTTCTPNKTSRSYWFEANGDGGWEDIEGEIRIYNFGATPARVRVVSAEALDSRVSVEWRRKSPDQTFTIAPMSRRVFPVTLGLTGADYLRAPIRYRAETLDAGGRVLADVKTSDGQDPAQNLISKGLAKPYDGGKKSSWCGSKP